MYCIKAVNKGKVGYRYYTYNIVANIINSLFLLLVYMEIILIFNIKLVIGSKLILV